MTVWWGRSPRGTIWWSTAELSFEGAQPVSMEIPPEVWVAYDTTGDDSIIDRYIAEHDLGGE